MQKVAIGEKFTNYYKSRDFKILESAPLLHPSLPMTFNMSAGLIQLEPIIRGKQKITNKKLVLIQDCFRHFDLNKIGDHHHSSFFQMPGAFEINDFNVRKVLEKIWVFLTDQLMINKDNIWVTTFKGDEIRDFHFKKDQASIDFWEEKGVGERLILYGREHNFWLQGGGFEGAEETRHCGRTSEIFYDLGKNVGCKRKTCKPGCPCGRFMEISNNLFITHFWDWSKEKFFLLKIPVSETVIGLERIAAVVENKKSIYKTYYFRPLMDLVSMKVKSNINQAEKIVNSRIVCDHIKALTFLFSEGAPPPGKNGRERIIRKLIRNLLTRLITLDIDSKDILPLLIDNIIKTYPSNKKLKGAKQKTLDIIYEHETVYRKTINRALRRIKGYLEKAGKEKPTDEDKQYFRQHFGIPIDLQNYFQNHA